MKSRNLIINMKQAFNVAPTIASGALAAIASPYPRAASALAVAAFLNALFSLMKVRLSPLQAGILFAMWQTKNENGYVYQPRLLEKVNEEFRSYGWQSITEETLISILEELERIGCIYKTAIGTGFSALEARSSLRVDITWKLQEEIKVSI